ncbi:UNVERIFIED_CONTAM: hypothetical protein FKN15_033114 [Acipenser sinensis]
MTVETDSDSESDPGLTSSDSGSDFYPTKTPSDVTEEEDFPSFMEEPARNPESMLPGSYSSKETVWDHMPVPTNGKKQESQN